MNEGADLQGIAPKEIAGVGRVLLWSGGSLWIGRDAGRGEAHSHHAIQISLGLSGPLAMRSEGVGHWSEYRGAIVTPHHRHQFDGHRQTVANIFVEPETVQGRALLALHSQVPIDRLPDGDGAAALAASLGHAFATGEADDALIGLSQRLVALSSRAELPRAAVDPRISRAIEWLRARLHEPLSLADAAGIAHLSPSRFRHLFVAQTGMSFRGYLLWARVGSAVGAAMGGLSWTEAAQSWGFADSAHLSRTCRRMFGIAPTMLVRG